MQLTKIELQGIGFNGVLASVWEYNKLKKEFLFTKNSLLMFGLKGVLAEEEWYSLDDELFKHVFCNQVIEFDNLLEFLDGFNSNIVVDFKVLLKLSINNDLYYLEGFSENEIINITAIENEASKQIDFLGNEGLINSKIGLRWIERINNEYRIFHMNSSRELYGIIGEHEFLELFLEMNGEK